MTEVARYFMRYSPGIVTGKPWAVRDDVLGRAAQTDGAHGPLAYFATETEAQMWTDDMNAMHAAEVAPAYEVEIPYWIEHARAFRARHAPSGVGSVKFV